MQCVCCIFSNELGDAPDCASLSLTTMRSISSAASLGDTEAALPFALLLTLMFVTERSGELKTDRERGLSGNRALPHLELYLSMAQQAIVDKGDPGLLARACPSPMSAACCLLFPPMWFCGFKQIRERQVRVYLPYLQYFHKQPNCIDVSHLTIQKRIARFHLNSVTY